MIAYISHGGISISDTDEVSPYDRKLILDTLTEIKKIENEPVAD